MLLASLLILALRGFFMQVRYRQLSNGVPNPVVLLTGTTHEERSPVGARRHEAWWKHGSHFERIELRT